MNQLARLLAAFCVGTVLTQLILLGYFAWRGTLQPDTLTKVVALVNGIDISGAQFRRIMEEMEQSNQPDFNDVLQSRTLVGAEMDLRLRSQRVYEKELAQMLEEIKVTQARFDKRREAFERKLEDIQRSAEDAGMKELQRTIQSLPFDQAKDQLLMFYDDGRIDEVVDIVQGIPLDTRKEIMAEFVRPEDAEKLHDVLRRIGEGQPLSSYVDEARQQD